MSEDADGSLQVGKLLDVQWTLGVAVTSNTCKNINSPFITMAVNVKDSSGNVVSTSFEMSLTEFQSFSRQIKDAAAVLETM